MNSGNERNKLKSPIAVVILVFLSFFTISLLSLYAWGFFTSLKSTDGFMRNMIGLPKGLPWTWEWKNYIKAFSLLSTPVIDNGMPRMATFAEMATNSLIYAIVGPLICLSVTWLMAYVTSQFNYKLSKFIYYINMVLMLVPIVGSLPSAIQLYSILNIYDTWSWLVLHSITFVGSTYLIFHAFFYSVAKEIKEAAMIDGAGNLAIMLRIVFPITFKMFGVLFLTQFIAKWNDYMTMVVWLPSKPNLAYGMYKFSTNTQTSGSWPPVQIAGCMILMIPILIIFLIFKDKVIGKLTVGALK